MIDNTKRFKNFISEIKLENRTLNNQKNQRLRMTSSKGLKSDNELYRKLIRYLKVANLVHKTKEFKPSKEDLKKIVINVYKNYHSSSVTRLQKFIDKYNVTIQEDVNSK